MDNVSKWIIKIGDWEYDKEKPKKKYNDIDRIANMLIDDYYVDVSHIEPYTELITFAYVNDNADDINVNSVDVNEIKKYITINGCIEKIIASYKTK